MAVPKQKKSKSKVAIRRGTHTVKTKARFYARSVIL